MLEYSSWIDGELVQIAIRHEFGTLEEEMYVRDGQRSNYDARCQEQRRGRRWKNGSWVLFVASKSYARNSATVSVNRVHRMGEGRGGHRGNGGGPSMLCNAPPHRFLWEDRPAFFSLCPEPLSTLLSSVSLLAFTASMQSCLFTFPFPLSPPPPSPPLVPTITTQPAGANNISHEMNRFTNLHSPF